MVTDYTKETSKSRTMVSVVCTYCSEHALKSLKDIEAQDKKGKSEFYCNTTCSGLAHSDRIGGENHPRYGTTWVNHPSKTMTPEQLTARALKAWDTSRENGTDVERIETLQAGREAFFSTEEGKALHREISMMGLKSCQRKNTSIEIKMREELERRGIEFEEQVRVGRFLLDFYLPEYEIAIECDGDYWHTIPSVVEKDLRKNVAIEGKGYALFRFWESEINECVESCVDIVFSEINKIERGGERYRD